MSGARLRPRLCTVTTCDDGFFRIVRLWIFRLSTFSGRGRSPSVLSLILGSLATDRRSYITDSASSSSSNDGYRRLSICTILRYAHSYSPPPNFPDLVFIVDRPFIDIGSCHSHARTLCRILLSLVGSEARILRRRWLNASDCDPRTVQGWIFEVISQGLVVRRSNQEELCTVVVA